MDNLDKTKLIHDTLIDRVKAQKDVGTFDTKLGGSIGIEASMIFYKIVELCDYEGEQYMEFEDKGWVMISSETLHQAEYFPWIPARTIRSNLSKLESLGLLISRIEDKSTDKTKYYSPNMDLAYDFIDVSKSIKRLPLARVANDTGKIGQCIGKSCQSQETTTPIKKVVKRFKIKDLNIKDPDQTIAKPRDLMFDAVATITQLDPKLVGSRIAKCSNLLKKGGYVPEDVLHFLTWWKLNDFRWRQSKQPPRPEDITTDIARSKSKAKAPDEPTNLFPADYIPGETGKEYNERKHDVTN